MKTIEELNERWWYRLVKVIITILLTLFAVGICTAIYFHYEPQLNNERSYIKCENGKEFILSENNITLYSDYMGTYDEQKARELCRNTPIKMTSEEYKEKYGEEPPSFYEKLEPIDLEKYRIQQYNLVSIYTEREWSAIIGYWLITIFGTLLFLEIIRRIFYYILLGKLKPSKK